MKNPVISQVKSLHQSILFLEGPISNENKNTEGWVNFDSGIDVKCKPANATMTYMSPLHANLLTTSINTVILS